VDLERFELSTSSMPWKLSETMVVENEPQSRGLFDKMKDIFS
jgi:hypothetical protein